jgi:hypothetical protein
MTLWLWLLTCLEPNKDFAIPFIFESLLKYWPHVNPFIYRFFDFTFFHPKVIIYYYILVLKFGTPYQSVLIIVQKNKHQQAGQIRGQVIREGLECH